MIQTFSTLLVQGSGKKILEANGHGFGFVWCLFVAVLFCLFFKFILRKHDLAKLQNTRLQTTCTIFSECTKAALCPPMLLCGSTSIDV